MRSMPAGLVSIMFLLAASNAVSAGKLVTLYSFCAESGCSDGRQPHQIMLDPRGNLVGPTFVGADGSGTLFQLQPKRRHNHFKLLHVFCSSGKLHCRDGDFAFGAPTADGKGNLYGGTEHGGRRDGGIVYKLTPAHWGYRFEVIYRFCSMPRCADGKGSDGAFAIDGTGNIFGTAFSGGAHKGGAFFELSPAVQGWTYKVLYDFCSRRACADGKEPLNGLTYAGASIGIPYDGVSALFGAAHLGGPQDAGVVYQLTPGNGGWHEKVLYGFCSQDQCKDGGNPAGYGALALDGAGNLFGTTENGPGLSGGVLYKLTPSVTGLWTQTTLYDLCPDLSCQVEANPLLDAGGNLVGTTSQSLYKFFVAGGNLEPLYTFCSKPNCSDGEEPEANLVLDGAGNFFGTTLSGGNGAGTIFKFTP